MSMQGQTKKKNSHVEGSSQMLHALAFNPLSKKDREDLESVRPKTRGDCVDSPHPCPFVSCRHNTYLDVLKDGSIMFNDARDVTELPYSNCVLDYQGENHLDKNNTAARIGVSRQYLGLVSMPMILRKIDRLKDLVDMPNRSLGNLAGAQEGEE